MENDRTKIESAVLIVAILFFAFYFFAGQNHVRKREIAPSVAVEVKGDVARPGIYLLEGSRASVASAAARAGARLEIPGALAGAKLCSGQSLDIADTKTGVKIKLLRMPAAALLACGLKLDINSASLDDLLLISHLPPGSQPKS